MFSIKKRPALLLLALLILFLDVQAQYQSPRNSIWKFGNGAGYNFITNTAISSQINAKECSNAVCDINGNLLFYSDGYRIWDRNDIPMPGANPLFPTASDNATQSTPQGALIVPDPGNSNRYYLFSLTSQELQNPGGGKLYYSLVDMSLNGGSGGVVAGQVTIPLDTGLSEHMIAIPACNAVWVLVHDRVTPTFKAFKLSAGGIATPAVSTSGVNGFAPPGPGNTYFTGNNYYLTGQFAATTQFDRLAATYFRGNCLELYDFDNTTGMVSNSRVIDSINDSYSFYGVSFSPDNSRLYASSCAASLTLKAFFQYNLNLPTTQQIRNSRQYLGSCNAALTQLQLGPDSRIYFNGNFISKLGVIQNPNALGTACGLNYQGTTLLSGTGSWAGFHNTIVTSLPLSTDTVQTYWKDTIICSNDPVTIRARPGHENYIWEDGSSMPDRQVNQAGKYWVMFVKDCQIYVDTFTVRAYSNEIDLGNDTLACGPFTLRPRTYGGNHMTYLWQDGSTKDFYPVQQSGTYRVRINMNGCILEDSVKATVVNLPQSLGPDRTFCNDEKILVPLHVHVPEGGSVSWNTGSTDSILIADDFGLYAATISHPECGSFTTSVRLDRLICNCEIMVPNAFSPNGDGINDRFCITRQSSCELSGYSLVIFNRWGQVVFKSDNPSESWDGSAKGIQQETGTYFYELNVNKGISRKKHYQKGDLILIR